METLSLAYIVNITNKKLSAKSNKKHEGKQSQIVMCRLDHNNPNIAKRDKPFCHYNILIKLRQSTFLPIRKQRDIVAGVASQPRLFGKISRCDLSETTCTKWRLYNSVNGKSREIGTGRGGIISFVRFGLHYGKHRSRADVT